MAEDIDDLLDEVESKFCASGPAFKKEKNGLPVKNEIKKQKGIAGVTSQKIRTSTRVTKLDKDVSEAIDDIFEDDGFVLEPTKVRNPNAVPKSTNPKSNDAVKCFPIYIGGTKYLKGMATTVSQRVCDKLHCISCDNKVISFDDFSWNDVASNYLFFRNNYPDFSRLKSALQPSHGYRAYSCQCSWKSARSLQDVQSDPSLKWVCTKH